MNPPLAPAASINLPVPVQRTTAIPAPPSQPIINIEALLSGQLSTATKKVYRTDFYSFVAYLNISANKVHDDALILSELIRVDRQQAAAYRDFLLIEKKLSASTICRRLSVINTVFEMLKEEGLVERNPFSRVKRPRVSNIGKTPAFNRKQAELILEKPNLATKAGRRDRILLLLLFYCGL